MSAKTFDFPAPRPWRIDGQAIRDREGGVVMSALNPANMETRKLIVDAVNGNVQTDEIKAVLVRMKQKEDALWTCKQPRIGTFAAALMLDGFRTAIAIAIGEYPRPKGKAEASALADADTRLTNAAKEIERLRAALNGFADEWEKYAEEENMRAPAWASCFRSFARDCRNAALGGEE